VQRRHRQDSEPEFALVSAAERALGQEPIRYPLQGHRIGAAGPALVQGVCAQVEEYLAWEGVVARVQGRKLARNREDAGVLGQPADQDPAGCGCVLGAGRFLAGIPKPSGRTIDR